MPLLIEYLQAERERLRRRRLWPDINTPKNLDNDLKRALYTTFYSPFTPITPPRNYTSDLLQGYMDNEVIYAIVSKIASTCARIPLKIVDDNADEIESHWAYDLIDKPNDDMTWTELIQAYYIYLLSIGNSFLYSPKLPTGKTRELWVMPSDLVEVVSGMWWQPVEGYRFREGNQDIMFDKNLVMHGKLFNPRFRSGSWLYGLSPIAVASEIVQSINGGNKALNNAFMNMGPPYIISSQTPEGLTQQQQEQLEQVYKKKYGGMQKDGSFSRQPMLTGTPVEVHKVGDSVIDLNILAQSEHALRVLCNVYGVDSKLFNDPAASTYNNMEQAYNDFYNNTVKPLNNLLAKKLTNFLLEPGLKFQHDYSDVGVLQSDFYTQAAALMQIDFMTPNEKRERCGLPLLDDPMMDELSSQRDQSELLAPAFSGNGKQN